MMEAQTLSEKKSVCSCSEERLGPQSMSIQNEGQHLSFTCPGLEGGRLALVSDAMSRIVPFPTMPAAYCVDVTGTFRAPSTPTTGWWKGML